LYLIVKDHQPDVNVHRLVLLDLLAVFLFNHGISSLLLSEMTVPYRYHIGSIIVNTFPFLVPLRYNLEREEITMSDADVYQLKLRIEQQLFDRLSELANRCGFSSANQFAGEALDLYAELMAELLTEQQEESKNFRSIQRKLLLEAVKSHQEKRKRK
jgi:hypothetical protein